MAEKKPAKKAAAPRKRATKKTAAAPKRSDEAVAPDSSTVYAARRDVYAFPLEEGGYFSTPVASRLSASHGPAVLRLRKELGIPLRGVFDEDMAEAVSAYQQENGLAVTGVVDKTTWDAIYNV